MFHGCRLADNIVTRWRLCTFDVKYYPHTITVDLNQRPASVEQRRDLIGCHVPLSNLNQCKMMSNLFWVGDVYTGKHPQVALLTKVG